MGDVFRTPDERFEGLPDFPFEPRYREVDGLRLGHLDEGEGPPVVFFHGEPTWSYLWRKVIPPVRDAGHRCIAPDYAGLRPLRQADRLRLVLIRPPHRARRDAARRPRPARRHGRRPRLGRADRPPLRGRASRPDLADRDHGHRACSPASSRCPRPGTRSATSSSAPRTCRSRCWSETPAPGAWSDEVAAAYDAPFPDPGVEGRRPGLPADPADLARRCPGRRRASAPWRRFAATAGRRSSCGPTPTRCCRSRSGRPSRLDRRRARRAGSRTPPTSSRRTPARRSAALIADWLG